MTTMPFDTPTAARRLRDSGMEAAQAEAIVTTFAEALKESMATKSDLQDVRLGLEHRMDVMERRLDARIDALDQKLDARIGASERKLGVRMDALDQKIDRLGDRLTIRLGGMMVVGFGVFGAILRLL